MAKKKKAVAKKKHPHKKKIVVAKKKQAHKKKIEPAYSPKPALTADTTPTDGGGANTPSPSSSP